MSEGPTKSQAFASTVNFDGYTWFAYLLKKKTKAKDKAKEEDLRLEILDMMTFSLASRAGLDVDTYFSKRHRMKYWRRVISEYPGLYKMKDALYMSLVQDFQEQIGFLSTRREIAEAKTLLAELETMVDRPIQLDLKADSLLRAELEVIGIRSYFYPRVVNFTPLRWLLAYDIHKYLAEVAGRRRIGARLMEGSRAEFWQYVSDQIRGNPKGWHEKRARQRMKALLEAIESVQRPLVDYRECQARVNTPLAQFGMFYSKGWRGRLGLLFALVHDDDIYELCLNPIVGISRDALTKRVDSLIHSIISCSE